jgi:hypothetical protein
MIIFVPMSKKKKPRKEIKVKLSKPMAFDEVMERLARVKPERKNK